MTGDPLASMAVEVEATFSAPIDRVWELLSDVERMAGLGPEHVAASWHTTGPAVGAHFTGTNQIGTFEWQVACVVTVCEPPRHLEWTVGDPPGQSSTWSYTLIGRSDCGTDVVQRFRHGPGFSYVRQRVDCVRDETTAIVERRCAILRRGMTETLAAAARVLDSDD